LIQERDRKGLLVRAEERASVDQGITSYGPDFLSEKALKANAKGKPLPADPYALNWYSEKEKEVFEAVGGGVAYTELYGPFSAWHHWRIAGFGRLISYDESRRKFIVMAQDPSFTASSLATACQCLYQTLNALSNIVPTAMATDLAEWYTSYVAQMRSQP
jgi:hypothetical protein